MHPLCLSLSWQECRALLAALEVSSLPPGLLRGGATVGLSSQEALTTEESRLGAMTGPNASPALESR